MYIVIIKQPDGAKVKHNSEFQPKISMPYDGMIKCSVDGVSYIVSRENFYIEWKDKEPTKRTEWEDFLYGKNN